MRGDPPVRQFVPEPAAPGNVPRPNVDRSFTSRRSSLDCVTARCHTTTAKPVGIGAVTRHLPTTRRLSHGHHRHRHALPDSPHASVPAVDHGLSRTRSLFSISPTTCWSAPHDHLHRPHRHPVPRPRSVAVLSAHHKPGTTHHSRARACRQAFFAVPTPGFPQ